MDRIKLVLTKIAYSNVVLIVNGPNSILVDTGLKNHLQEFKTLFKKYNLLPEDIKLIVLTHTHHDHTGNLQELKNLCNAKVLVHQKEFESLKGGYIRIPKGLSFRTRVISTLGRIFVPKIASPKPFVADLINPHEYDLSSYGIEGKVISTPGHTSGSQSILIGNTLISGDTFINLPNGTIFPHFADDAKQLIQTWQKLLDMGINEIYPGHGKKLNREQVLEEFQNWKTKLQ